MKCTRCKQELNYGKYYWHIPICSKCRKTMIDNKDFDFTKREKEIIDKRFREENNDN
jgi:hypothetical protein